jgi:ParB family chromosome partitioning protein
MTEAARRLLEHDESAVRKDLVVKERVEIGRRVEAALGKRQGAQTDLESPEVAGRETREIAAKKAGFGSDYTYRQAKAVVDQGMPDLVPA